jgi:hypothetical protein
MSLSILPTSRWLPKRRRPPMVVKRQSRHSWPRLTWETRVRLITSAEYKQRLVRTLSELPLGSAHRRCAGTWFIPSNGGRNGAGIRLWFGSTRLLLSVDRPRPENPADQRRARIYCRYRSFQRGISLRIRTLHSMSLCRASRLSTYSVIRCICCSSPGVFSRTAVYSC